MIVICEECGKKYQIDPDKLKGETGKAKCKACGNLITIKKSDSKAPDPTPPPPPPPEEEKALQEEQEPVSKPLPEDSKESESKKRKKKSSSRVRSLGVRSKMILLFVSLPTLFMCATALFSIDQLQNLSGLIIDESSKTVGHISTSSVNDNADFIAKRTQAYLSNHPDLREKDFSRDEGLRKIITRSVEIAGDSTLFVRSGDDHTGTILLNKKTGLEGTTLEDQWISGTFRGAKYDKQGKVILGEHGWRDSTNYFLQKDDDGQFKEIILSLAPVLGTPYVIGLSVYADHFFAPINQLDERSKMILLETRNVYAAIIGAGILLIGLVVTIFSYRLAGRIRRLTEAADRISVGELDVEIKMKSKDEIGELAKAITRMQDSIRISISRLRRRR